MSHRHRQGGAVAVALTTIVLTALLLAGCSSKDDGSDASSSTSKTESTSKGSAKGPTESTERKVVGSATTAIGERSWTFELTACVAGKDRITAQGDDGEGTTVVASFGRSSKVGSVTVWSADEAWSIGPAGGTRISGAKVSKSGASGSGEFTRRRFEDPEPDGGSRPAGMPGTPTEGTFEVTCKVAT